MYDKSKVLNKGEIINEIKLLNKAHQIKSYNGKEIFDLDILIETIPDTIVRRNELIDCWKRIEYSNATSFKNNIRRRLFKYLMKVIEDNIRMFFVSRVENFNIIMIATVVINPYVYIVKNGPTVNFVIRIFVSPVVMNINHVHVPSKNIIVVIVVGEVHVINEFFQPL